MRLSTPTLAFNPVLVKELRGRMRGPRAFVFLTGVLVLLGLVSYGLFQLAMPRYFGFQSNIAAGAMIGQTVFVGLVFLTLMLICAIAPSLTAGGISGEHQHKTFDLLMATPLAPISILTGKLGAALSYIALILLAAVPITSLAYVFGGVTPTDLLRAFAVMAAFALVYAVMGLFFSALFNRTGLAVGASYFLLGFFALGTLFLYAVVGVMRSEQPPNWILALNPFSTMASVMVDGIVTDQNSVYNGSSMTPLLWGLSGGRFDDIQNTQVPLWQFSLGIYAWLTLILFALTTQLIKPMHRFRLRFWMWLGIGMVGLGVGAAVAVWSTPALLAPLRSAIRYQFDEEHNVVANANFAAPFPEGWQVDTANAAVFTSTDRQALHFWNHPGSELRVQNATQALNLPLPDTGIVRLRMVFRISGHETPVCGARGEFCPLMVKLQYTDGTGRGHEWSQGFYTTGVVNRRQGVPPRCRVCEMGPNHKLVPADEWFVYETGDLFAAQLGVTAPRSLNLLTLRTAGATYVTQIAEVSLLVREGRPFFYGENRNEYGSYYGSIVPYWLYDLLGGGGGGVRTVPVRGGMQVIPLQRMPQPTAAPRPPIPRSVP